MKPSGRSWAWFQISWKKLREMALASQAHSETESI